MARLLFRVLPLAAQSPLPPPPPPPKPASLRSPPRILPARPPPPPPPSSAAAAAASVLFTGRRLSMTPSAWQYATSSKGIRNVARRRALKKKNTRKEKQQETMELDVKICIDEELPEDPQLLNIAEALQTDIARAMQVAFDGLANSAYKTRDNSINDFDRYEKVELSLLLCNDNIIRELNMDWRGEDHPTDVLSMSQHVPELDLPTLLLGNIVISVETAARQAENRGHTLLDEIRVLMVHGLLHLLGFDHEISDEAADEMEREEERILQSLEWKGKGLIKSAYDAATNNDIHIENLHEGTEITGNEGVVQSHEPKLSYIICDLDSAILDGKGQVNPRSVEALRVAVSSGANIVVATGKSRPSIIKAFQMVNEGEKDVVSELSPGVFLQGSLVYGRAGQEIYRANLDQNVCRKAFLYSLEHEVPLVAFCNDQSLTLFGHPLVDLLHTVHHEPKPKIMPSIQHLLAYSPVQKLIFLDSPEKLSLVVRPYWSEEIKEEAQIIQTLPDMLEITPPATSKGSGLMLLLQHLGFPPEELETMGETMLLNVSRNQGD